MKRFLYLLSRPCVWLWKFLSSGLTVIFNLLVVTLLLAGLALVLYTPKITVQPGSALVLAPEGNIVEVRSPIDPFARVLNRLSGSPFQEETFLQDILDTLQEAADDQRIKMLVLNTNKMGDAGLDQIRTIGTAIDAFKKKDKKVIAVGNNFNQTQYYLASWADSIYLHPMGAVQIRGFSVFRLYVRDMLDKLGINAHVFRVGDYKSAVEPLLRNDMSPEDKEANRLWLNNLWNIYCTDIVKHRKLNLTVFRNNINQIVSQLASVDGDRARLALASGLVDGLKTPLQIDEMLKQMVGLSSDKKSCNHIGFRDYLQTITPSYTKSDKESDLIGIIAVSGNIIPGKGTPQQIGAEDLIKRIRQARQNPRIKAIVLRINSGGGSATASELIREELAAARQDGKVVVVSMGAMAASGGYWLSANADAIVAAPTTLTGSIGIFGMIPTMEKTLAGLGIHGDGIGTTNIAHFGNMATAMGEEEAASWQMDVEQGYQRFINTVAQGRSLNVEAVEKIAGGRVWDGETALKIGLVDKLGNLQDAIAEAAKRANVPKENALFIELDPRNYLNRFKKNEQPIETLIRGLFASSPGILQMRQAAEEQLDFIVDSRDPRGLYSHCLFPSPAPLFR